MNFGNIVIMMSRFGSKSGDFAQRGDIEPEIGFSIVIKDSPYDVLPVMPFKK